MRSTFAGFTTAQLAMRASQKALDVTGQNIANINKQGYTRQRLDLVSLNSSMGVNKYESQFNVKIGNGVLTKGLSQIRDPFLDIRFRTESANVGTADQKLVALKDLELIFDEITKEGTQNQLSEITSMLQKLSSEVGNKEFDSMVRSSSDVFTKMLNQYAKQLSGIRTEQETNLDIDVMKVNDILTNIKELNKTIKNNHIHGNAALELQDERNLLIDELSSFMKIEVTYTPNQISSSTKIEELSINFITNEAPPNNKISLIDSDKFAAQLTAPPSAGTGGKKTMSISKPDGTTQVLVGGAVDLFEQGRFKGSLDMLNKSGEFDTPQNTTRGIGYYEQSLDLLAAKFAESFNQMNRKPTFDAAGNITGYTDKNLFASFDGSATITARNITISEGWKNGTVDITASVKKDSPIGANDNILNMISMMSEKKEYKTPDKPGPPVVPGVKLTEGSFQEMYTNMSTVLALDIKSTTSVLDNFTAVADDIANLRDDISSVSLDEEGMNILHYQKSYNAAARLMTALDEAIDTVINRMGVVGR